ncbi:hypothetical protein F4810DRAFT_672737 [Camillea tinctor]|nr:hypothetical protein F4810DRAFT_672737 [Camillea tinctor]
MVSPPHRTNFQRTEFNEMRNRATSKFQRGEYKDAREWFRGCEKFLKPASDDELQEADVKLASIQIRISIAAIDMYLPEDQASQIDWASIRDELKEVSVEEESAKSRVVIDLERWYALSLVFGGYYTRATKQLEGLLRETELFETLESMNADVSKLQVLRDLALANALSGKFNDAWKKIEEATQLAEESMARYNIPISAPETGPQNEREPISSAASNGSSYTPLQVKRLLAKRNSVLYTAGMIDFLWGADYEHALKKVETAYERFTRSLGPRHLHTLKSASLRIILLAYNSRYQESLVAFNKTSELMKSELGESHPKTLETGSFIVEILNSQSRFIESVATAKSLHKTARISLRDYHPLRVRSDSQLALSHLGAGNYQQAVLQLEGVVEDSKKCYEEYELNPNTLYYQSELARVYCKLGRVREAKKLALDVLKMQTHFYHDSLTTSKCGREKSEEILNNILEVGNSVLTRIHPRILFTMEVIASTELQSRPFDYNITRKILWIVFIQRLHSLGHQQASTLTSAYNLAVVYAVGAVNLTSDNLEDLRISKFFLAYVYCQRVALFGTNHPETEFARRELLSIKCAQGKWQDSDDAFVKRGLQSYKKVFSSNKSRMFEEADITTGLDLFEGEMSISGKETNVEHMSRDILRWHELHLGKYHPETMRSLLWLFTVHLGFDTPVLEDVSDQLLKRLEHKSLKTERLVETLEMKEGIALMYREKGFKEKANEVLHGLEKDSEEQPSHGELHEELRDSLKQFHDAVLKMLAEQD